MHNLNNIFNYQKYILTQESLHNLSFLFLFWKLVRQIDLVKQEFKFLIPVLKNDKE